MKLSLTDEQIIKLGKVPDRVIAEELGVSIQVVYAERTSRHILPCGKHSEIAYKKLSMSSHQTLITELGRERDSILARKYGISREYVRQLRNRYNIPKYSIFIANRNN